MKLNENVAIVNGVSLDIGNTCYRHLFCYEAGVGVNYLDKKDKHTRLSKNLIACLEITLLNRHLNFHK